MNKITLFLILSCYMLMSTGVVAVSHYCMDKLASVSFFVSSEKKCSKCGMKKQQHGCCNDEETLLKGDTDQNKIPQYTYSIPTLDAVPVLTTDFLLTGLLNGSYTLNNENRPPPLPDKPLYLANNVFRI